MKRTIGIKFPFEQSKKNHFFAMSENSNEAVISNFKFLITTPPKQRIYKPDFSFDLRQFLFEQNDGQTQEALIKKFKEITTKYFPQIKIENVASSYNNRRDALSLDIQCTVNGERFEETIIF